MAASIQVMMACGAFTHERALAISTCFFALTTDAMDVTVNANPLGTQTLADLEAVHSTTAF